MPQARAIRRANKWDRLRRCNQTHLSRYGTGEAGSGSDFDLTNSYSEYHIFAFVSIDRLVAKQTRFQVTIMLLEPGLLRN